MAGKKEVPRRDPRKYAPTLENWRGDEKKWWSMIALPKKMKSSVLLEDEEILLVVRQHWIVFVPKLLVVAMLLFVPIMVCQVELMREVSGLRLLIGACLLSYLAIAGYLLHVIVTWFFNVYIITDERLIDVAFDTILSSDISIMKTDKIQDHSLKSNGFWETLLRYGTIVIQTAGAEN
ncbi:PH domain-containing protein, partial [Microgenomates group bacterium]|nr:PH domain-containing protein [Microgenomates group bacterium]